jgi:ABC-type multidrug transport system permease subunit
MNKSLITLIQVHFKTFFREPAILFWAVLFPILMAWVLGIAFSSKSETLTTVYVTGTSPAPERISGEKVMGDDTGNPFRIRFTPASEDEAVKAIKRGIITLYIEVQNDSLVFHFDPRNPDAQLTHLMLERDLSGTKATATRLEPLEAKGTRYIDFLVPGLVALGIMNACVWGIGWGLIETRQKKLMRRMIATPMKKTAYLSSLMVTRIILGGFEIALLLLFAWLYFGTTLTGSWLAFVVIFLSGIFAFSGIAILMASRTDKSEVANGLINAITLPMMILSGIFFNYHNFPDWAVSVIQVLPLTLLADSLRAIFVEAAGLRDVLTAVVVLCATGLVTYAVGLKVFKWY